MLESKCKLPRLLSNKKSQKKRTLSYGNQIGISLQSFLFYNADHLILEKGLNLSLNVDIVLLFALFSRSGTVRVFDVNLEFVR